MTTDRGKIDSKLTWRGRWWRVTYDDATDSSNVPRRTGRVAACGRHGYRCLRAVRIVSNAPGPVCLQTVENEITAINLSTTAGRRLMTLSVGSRVNLRVVARSTLAARHDNHVIMRSHCWSLWSSLLCGLYSLCIQTQVDIVPG